MNSDNVIYLDNNASTPCDERVVEAMLPYFSQKFWNPGSAHGLGRVAWKAVEESRERVASWLHVSPELIVFTSGATESVQLAIEGLPDKLIRLIPFFVSPMEHRAVRNAVERVARRGASVRWLALNKQGEVDSMQVTVPGIYVIQAVNSESGVIQPVVELFKRVKSAGGILIVDASQALWKVDVSRLVASADALILSAHKAYGPKGIGAMVLSPEMQKLLRGSAMEAQEHGIREGTQNTPLIVGFATLVELIDREGEQWRVAAGIARDELEALLVSAKHLEVEPLFSHMRRVSNTASLCVHEIPGDVLVTRARNLAISFGTACSSGAVEPSYALQAFGVDRVRAAQTVRVSFGRDSTRDLAATAFDSFRAVVECLRGK